MRARRLRDSRSPTQRRHEILTFDHSIQILLEKELVIVSSEIAGYSLNLKKKAEIERYL